MKPRQAIFIMTDSQRQDMVSAYGHSPFSTPHLDRLAAGGLRCNQAYGACPVCTPARSATFSGLPPHQNGAWANQLPFGDSVLNLGQRLEAAGIEAAYVGKWHLDGSDYFGTGEAAPGWNPRWWHDMRNYLEAMPDEHRRLSRSPAAMAEQPDVIDRGFCYAAGCTDRAVQFLEQAADRSFFLTVSYDEPHHPWLSPSEYYNSSEAQSSEAPEWLTPSEDKPLHVRQWARKEEKSPISQEKMRAIHACNRFVDDEIGRVLDAIDRHCPEALVIYTSDHGEFFGEHGLSSKGPAMYQEITRIPFLMRCPSISTAPSQTSHLVSHLDLVPTFLDYFGHRIPASMRGKSLLPLLEQPDRPIQDTIFMEFNRFNATIEDKGTFFPIRCAFDGRYKLVLNLLDRDELYDLQEDPREQGNRIDDPRLAPQRDALHVKLLDWMRHTVDPFRGAHWESRPWNHGAKEPDYWPRRPRLYRPDNGSLPPELDYATGLPAQSD